MKEAREQRVAGSGWTCVRSDCGMNAQPTYLEIERLRVILSGASASYVLAMLMELLAMFAVYNGKQFGTTPLFVVRATVCIVLR